MFDCRDFLIRATAAQCRALGPCLGHNMQITVVLQDHIHQQPHGLHSVISQSSSHQYKPI